MIGWVSLVLEFICLLIRRKSINTLFPYTTLFRSLRQGAIGMIGREEVVKEEIRQIIGQLSFFQSYHDIRFVAIFEEDEYKDWEWLKWLLHIQLPHMYAIGLIYN